MTQEADMPIVCGMNDLLTFVRDELHRSRGDLNRIAKATGVSYDTVLRIKNAEGDPGYSKVQILAQYFHKHKEAA